MRQGADAEHFLPKRKLDPLRMCRPRTTSVVPLVRPLRAAFQSSPGLMTIRFPPALGAPGRGAGAGGDGAGGDGAGGDGAGAGGFAAGLGAGGDGSGEGVELQCPHVRRQYLLTFGWSQLPAAFCIEQVRFFHPFIWDSSSTHSSLGAGDAGRCAGLGADAGGGDVGLGAGRGVGSPHCCLR